MEFLNEELKRNLMGSCCCLKRQKLDIYVFRSKLIQNLLGNEIKNIFITCNGYHNLQVYFLVKNKDKNEKFWKVFLSTFSKETDINLDNIKLVDKEEDIENHCL